MAIFKICILFFIFALISINSFSQEVELTFKKVAADAIRNNINVVKSQELIESQESVIKASYSDILPSLSLNGGVSRTNNVNNGGTTTINGVTLEQGYSNTTTSLFQLSLRADVTLFNGFSNYERVDNAKTLKTKYVSELEKTKQDIVFKLLGDYITVLKNKQIVLIDSATLDDSKAQLASVKIFVEVGKKTQSDVYKQDAVVAANELALEQAKNNLNKSIADMVFDANISQSKIYTVAGNEFPIDISFESMQSYVERNSNTDILVNNAIKNRYDYRAAEQNIEVLRITADIADNNVIFPTITGYTSYGTFGDKLGRLTNARAFSVGLSLIYPLFQGFTADNQRQQARINLRMADEDLNQLRNQYYVDVKKAVLDLKSLLKQVEIADRSLKSTEQDRYSAEESYKVGLNTLLEVNTAETNYNNALINKSNIVYNFILAQKQLEYLQGLVKY